MISALAFKKKLEEKMKEVDMDPAFTKRYLNEGDSLGARRNGLRFFKWQFFNPQ